MQQYARIRETGESIRGKRDEIEAKEGEFNPYFARAYPFVNLNNSYDRRILGIIKRNIRQN